MTTRKLTEKQKRFVAEYVKDLNATKAAERAGYSVKTAEQLGYQLLQKPSVKAAVEKATEKVISKTEITAGRIIEEYRRIALFDPQSVLDEKGKMLPLHKWPKESAAAIGTIEFETTKDADGNDVTTVSKVRPWDKRGALNDLGRIFGLINKDVPAAPVVIDNRSTTINNHTQVNITVENVRNEIHSAFEEYTRAAIGADIDEAFGETIEHDARPNGSANGSSGGH